LEGQELAARHIALRERAGLTQEQEAKSAGVSPTTISGIESGKITRPHLKTLLKIARALGVDVGELREPGKAEAPPSSAQPPLNGFDEEERRVDRRGAALRDAIEDLRRTADLYERLHAIQEAMDEYREVWERRLAEGDFDKTAFLEGGRALKAFWPAVTAAADAEVAEMVRHEIEPEEAMAKGEAVLLPAVARFQVLCDRVNRTYLEKFQNAAVSNVYPFPQRKAS
jgi:transcriptional regulator with XRE-family HTH domain